MKHDEGFTLIELMLAMAIFGFLLIIMVSGYLLLTHIEQNGLASRAAQDNVRQLRDELVAAVRSSTQAWPIIDQGESNPPSSVLCLTTSSGIVEYALDAASNLWVGTPAAGTANSDTGTCPPLLTPIPAGWRQLNDASVKVPLFYITVEPQLTGVPSTLPGQIRMPIEGTVLITIGTQSIDDQSTLITPRNGYGVGDAWSYVLSCQPGSSQFCSATTLSTAAELAGVNQ